MRNFTLSSFVILVSFFSFSSSQLSAFTSKLGFPWHPSHFIWSLAYPQSVNVSLSDPPYKSSRLKTDRVRDIPPGTTIWINIDKFSKFYKNVFPKLEHPFILVMTGCDQTFPESFSEECDIPKFLNDPRVIHVFTQNIGLNYVFENLSPIPIGLNFHNLIVYAHDHVNSLTDAHSIKDQENDLFSIIDNAYEPKERLHRILCDFQIKDTLAYSHIPGNRREIAKVLSETELADFLDERIKRKELWEMKSIYAFSASPHGNGLDCHRTWEDLALGCIVIVKTSTLDSLYEGLPVAIVDDWSDVTQEKLDGWIEEFGDTLNNPDYRDRLTHNYWMDKIQEKQLEYLMNLN